MGSKRKKFTVHKGLLCKATDFFDKAFNSRFQEGNEGIMYLPDDKPGVVALFLHWVYRGDIPTGSSQSYVYDLYDLYIFAEKICNTHLKDRTMDAIQIVAGQHWLTEILITSGIVKKVFKGISHFEGLQQFTINLMAWVFHQRCEGIDGVLPTRKIKSEDLKFVSELGKENFEIEDRFHARFQHLIQFNRLNVTTLADPRFINPQCIFHCHKIDTPCYTKKKNNPMPMFIMDVVQEESV